MVTCSCSFLDGKFSTHPGWCTVQRVSHVLRLSLLLIQVESFESTRNNQSGTHYGALRCSGTVLCMAPKQPHPFGGPFKCISHCILSPSRKYSNGHCKAKAVDERNSSGVLMQVVAQYPVYSNKKAEVTRLKLTLTRTTSLDSCSHGFSPITTLVRFHSTTIGQVSMHMHYHQRRGQRPRTPTKSCLPTCCPRADHLERTQHKTPHEAHIK